MAACNIPEVDAVLDTPGSPPIDSSSSAAAIGAIQDLLRGHGYKMPRINALGYGSFGSKTSKAVTDFRKKFLPGTAGGASVDAGLLKAMVELPAEKPVCSRVYVARVLDLEFKEYVKLACYVSVGEGNGRFAVLCRNTDRAGLSAGIIQWAQRPERLHELLNQCDTDAHDDMVSAFGSPARVAKLLAHTKKRDLPKKVTGGVLPTGVPEAADADMDLTQNAWPPQFVDMLTRPSIQKVQIDLATSDFSNLKAKFDAVSAAPRSERLVAYLLDIANQFGSNAETLFNTALGTPGLPPATPATQASRDAMLITALTSAANDLLRTIGEKIVSGKQKWSEATIQKVQKSRSDRGDFFATLNDLLDTAVPL